MSTTRTRSGKQKRAAVTPAADAVPRWAPVVLYAAVTLLLFREAIFTGAGLLGTDSMALSYFARDFYTDAVRSGTFPLWNPLVLGGLPFVEGMHGDIFYPPSLALFVLDPRTFWTWKMAGHVFAAGVFTYLWLRRGLGLGRGPAMFGGLVYMMGADLVSLVYPGGDGKLFVSALAPLVFLLAERCVSLRRVADFAFFALSITLVMLTSHMQLAYFTVWGVSLYMMFRAAQVWRAEGAGKAATLFGGFTLAGVLGVGAAAVQFLPPLGYLQEWSQRADKSQAEAAAPYEYATSWSLHAEEVMALVVPEFVGDNAPTETRGGNTYWGRNPFKLNHEYAGFLPLLLAPILFLRRREPRTWFFTGLAALALVYALGANTPFFRLFYLVPGVSLFRAPSLIIFLYGLSVATLGALALERMQHWAADATDREAITRYLWIAVAVLGGLALLAAAGGFTALWQSVVYRDIPLQKLTALQANLPNIQLGFWLTFLFSLVVAGTWTARARGAFGPALALWIIVAVAVVDEYRVGRPFVRATVLLNERGTDPTLFEPDETIRFLQERQAAGEVFRVFDVGPFLSGASTYGNNILAIHGIEQLGGHHGNEMRYFDRLIGGADQVPAAVPAGGVRQAADLTLLQRTNATYIVSPQRFELPGLEEVYVGSRSAVYRMPDVLPRAYLTGSVEVVGDDVALERMLSPDFDAGATTLLAEALGGAELQPGVQGSVAWEDRGLNGMTLRVMADRPAALVVLDNYYSEWRAEVDGEAVPLVRANLAFRALPVPAGEHVVTLRYVPRSLRTGVLASAALLLALLLIACGSVLIERRRRAGSGTAP